MKQHHSAPEAQLTRGKLVFWLILLIMFVSSGICSGLTLN